MGKKIKCGEGDSYYKLRNKFQEKESTHHKTFKGISDGDPCTIFVTLTSLSKPIADYGFYAIALVCCWVFLIAACCGLVYFPQFK
jgi:hypothetical protein